MKESTRSPSSRGRPRVRFYDEVTQLPWVQKMLIKAILKWAHQSQDSETRKQKYCGSIPSWSEIIGQIRNRTSFLKDTYPLSGCREIKTSNLLFLVKYHRCLILLNFVIISFNRSYHTEAFCWMLFQCSGFCFRLHC